MAGVIERRPDPWPPGTRRAAGGGCAFRVGPHFSRPSARRELLRHRARCAQRSLPVPCMLQRCPILGGSDGLQEGVSKPTNWPLDRLRVNGSLYSPTETPSQGHGGLVPAATLLPCARPNGSEGNGIGNARGIPPRGGGRRHLFGCQGVDPAFRGRTPAAASQISATSLARVQRGGVNPGHCARGFGAMSHWPVSDWPVGRRLKLALRGEYSTAVLEYVKSDCGSCDGL